MKNKDLKDRILEISFKNKLSHLGSCLTAVDIIEQIYKIKKPDEKFVLSAGHCGLALYVVIEKYEKINAEEILLHHGIHPDKCEKCNLYCSSGSLGHGLPIAIGFALADRKKNVYCLISDGECAEGSIWESLNIFEYLMLENLHIYVNLNRYGAYCEIDILKLGGLILRHTPKMKSNIHLIVTNIEQYPFLKGNEAHYHILTEKEYACNIHL